MDIVTLALAKKFALKVSAGFSSVEVDEENLKIIFTLNDGQKVSLSIPKLRGVGNIYLEDKINLTTGEIETHLMFKINDSKNTIIDSGVIPKQEIKISKEEGNILVPKVDGLYVPSTGVKISPAQDNILKNTDEGLYAKMSEIQVMDTIKGNIETENIDFSDFF